MTPLECTRQFPGWLEYANVIVPTVTTFVSVFAAYWLVTGKEKRAQKAEKTKAEEAEPHLRLGVMGAIAIGRVAESYEQIRDFGARTRAMGDYGELLSPIVFKYLGHNDYIRFGKCLRITYHLRDSMGDLLATYRIESASIKAPKPAQRLKFGLEKLLTEIEMRIENQDRESNHRASSDPLKS